MERPSITPISLNKYFFVVSIYFSPFLPMIARNISSNVGCFSTYSTFAGGNSFFSSASVPLAIILPSCRMAIRSASCSASSRYCVVRNTVVPLLASSLTTFQLNACLGVKSGRRLVEENKLRFSHKAHGDVESAAHTARIGGNPAVGGVGQTKAV